MPVSTDAKDVTRRFYEEIINQKNVDAIDRFCTAAFVDHNPSPGVKAASTRPSSSSLRSRPRFLI
jgi:hypothetical protein